MIAELVLRSDPSATLALVSFVVVGIIFCVLRLFWLFVKWEQKNMAKAEDSE